MAKLLEIRRGLLREHTEIRSKLVDGTKWPVEISSGWIKNVVDGKVKTNLHGLEGDEQGFPTHIADSLNRGMLVFHEDTYKHLLEKFPTAKQFLVRGGFAENFVVNGPTMLPNVVCVGDKYQVGSTIVYVSGARHACPKVDAWNNVSGLTQYSNQNGMAGYFFRVIQEGECCAGDEIKLLERPHPGYTIEKINMGLHGAPEQLNNSREFLTYVSKMEQLIGRHFRDVAVLRLQRLDEEESKDKAESTGDSTTSTNNSNRVVYLMSLFVLLFAVFMYTRSAPLRS